MIRLTKWIKSSFCDKETPGGGEGNDCVEAQFVRGLATDEEWLILRDNTGAEVTYDQKEWEAFLKGVKAGEFEWDVIKEGSNPHACSNC